MRNLEADNLLSTARRTARAYTRHQLETQWSSAAARAAIRSGDLTRLLPGIYSASDHACSLITRSHASLLWAPPGAGAVGRSAAAAWELWDATTAVVDLAVPYFTSKPTPAWLNLIRVATPPPAASWHAAAVCGPEFAIATAYGRLPRHLRDNIVYCGVQRGLTSAASLAQVLTSMPRVKHRRSLNRVVAAVACGAESVLGERAMRDVFTGAEFAGFVRQHHLRLDGQLVRADMFEPATRTVVELDGGTHAVPVQRERDIRRDALLAAHGIATVRFSDRDITQRPELCRKRVRAVLAARVVAIDT